ncbi:hypothetical protein CRYUN_Cryun20dG0040100 [Craigia yunnanensis]
MMGTHNRGGRGLYKGIGLDKLTHGKRHKLVISIPPRSYFRPVGDNVSHLTSWIGYCVRSTFRAPIHKWEQVQLQHGQHLMNMIMEKSETNTKCRQHLQMISSTGSRAFVQVKYNMMDPETGDMPLTSDLWMTQYGFTTKKGEKKWHDSKSEEEKIKRIEERDESEGQEVLSSEVILNEILGVMFVGEVHGIKQLEKAPHTLLIKSWLLN